MRDLVEKLLKTTGSAGKGKYGEVFVIQVNGQESKLCRQFPGACNMCRQFPTSGQVLVKLQRYHGKKNRHKTAQAEFDHHRRLAMPGKCATLPLAGTLCTAPIVPKIYAGIDSGAEFLTFMEYIEGDTLNQVLQRQGGRISPAQFAALERAVLALWANGYSHNDLHDKNIMFDKQGKVRLIDMGLSFRYDPPAKHPANVIPTAKYARDITDMADTLLTKWQIGRPPFPASTANMRMMRLYARLVGTGAA